MSDSATPEYYLVAKSASRSSSRRVKHLPNDDSDAPLATVCSDERDVDTEFRRRDPDDPIASEYRLCRYCDPEHDHSPTGGTNEINNLLLNSETVAEINEVLTRDG